VTKTAELRANNLVSANLRRREVYGEIKARHEILLNTQLAHKEGVSDIFRMHQQANFPVHGYRHLGSHNVVFGVGIVGRIQPEEVLRGTR